MLKHITLQLCLVVVSAALCSSGLAQEEAAMIQPGHPVTGITTFDSLMSQIPELESNGLTLSQVSIRSARFTATLPASFATNPNAIETIFAQGLVELENDHVVAPAFKSTRGLLLGASGSKLSPGPKHPGALQTWLYFGSDDGGGGLVEGASDSGNVGIIEIDYQIRAGEGSNFSKVAVTSTSANVVSSGEQNAVLFLSEIYGGDSNELLKKQQVLGVGSQTLRISGSETASLSDNFLRIKTYGLVAGNGSIDRIFNEFETAAAPKFLRGDVDKNGVVNFSDIQAFNDVLEAGTFQAEADINSDGSVDFRDMDSFSDLLRKQ